MTTYVESNIKIEILFDTITYSCLKIHVCKKSLSRLVLKWRISKGGFIKKPYLFTSSSLQRPSGSPGPLCLLSLHAQSSNSNSLFQPPTELAGTQTAME